MEKTMSKNIDDLYKKLDQLSRESDKNDLMLNKQVTDLGKETSSLKKEICSIKKEVSEIMTKVDIVLEILNNFTILLAEEDDMDVEDYEEENWASKDDNFWENDTDESI
jgi:hypothetical protein